MFSRRHWIGTLALGAGATMGYSVQENGNARLALDLGSRRELFVDPFLLEDLGHARLKLHEPRLAAASQALADPLEYGTIIQDGAIYRLYTRDGRGARFDGDSTEVTRYCESQDGINWIKPKLGLVELEGSKENNVILKEAPFCHNFCPFLDNRPGVPAGERFKALAGTVKSMLHAFVSPDGIRWKRLQEEPVISYRKEYAFDSQNVAFWSESEDHYVCYFRHFLEKKWRSVCRTTSPDFLNWSEPVPMRPNFAGEHLYTTLTHPYFRAPHIYIATPTRFHPDRGESTDILFMTARGNAPFDRTFREAFIRPGLDPARWGNRSNYAALNVVQTGPEEMSIYTTPFRRFILRLDGFSSLNAGADKTTVTTRLLRFRGDQLHLNFSTSAGGVIQTEILGEDGNPVEGFELNQNIPLTGDSIDQSVRWKGQVGLGRIAGRNIQVRFTLQEADIFAMQFRS